MMLLVLFLLLFVTLIIVGLRFLLSRYKVFTDVRLQSLSIAPQVDSVGGVGISMLCVSVEGVSAVVNLLGTEYPYSEVVVAVNREKHQNLIALLQLRYSLTGVQYQDVIVYRSECCCFRRLVVVVAKTSCNTERLLEYSAEQAIYNYLLVVPSTAGLLPYAVGIVADAIAAQTYGRVDVVTTMDRGVVAYSRQSWKRRRDENCQLTTIEIKEPIVLDKFSQEDDGLLIERARYNFWDFLSLNIMRYRNKLLSLRKP